MGDSFTAARLGPQRGCADLRQAVCGTPRSVIADVIAAIGRQNGCLLARMSGSGATCFALFEDDAACARGADILRLAHGGWWIAPTFTL